MARNKQSTIGDRIDLGGKLPQFDAFAWFAYKELLSDNLAWIRIADPEAKKLDDIQYATKSQIHAYQVKWSNLERPEPFSFTDFINLLPEIASGWQSLKTFHVKEKKQVIAHLLTNRPLSKHDSIKSKADKVGSFADFYSLVWINLKNKKPIPAEWQPVADEIGSILNIESSKVNDFVDNFEFEFNFQPHTFGISHLNDHQQNEDLILFSRFLFEEIANKERKVLYPSIKIIQSLNWSDRFKTIFNHELIVDQSRYQPITDSINELNKKVTEFDKGYIFLIGGPGSGKSTLLSEWSRQRSERIIRYYAFDFTNPSSPFNYSARGESESLLFDLVYQIKQSGYYKSDSLPYKEITFLRTAFIKQLDELNKDYATTGRKTFVIIDGLDHVPREYKFVAKSFLADLLTPASIPNGILIILGSQSFELEDLQTDVKLEWQSKTRNINISPLSKRAVFDYIESSNTGVSINEELREKIFTLSQGHPLYLSYLINKIKVSGLIEFGNEFTVLDTDITSYYTKIWQDISTNSGLIGLLGLISRIQGSISPIFINEWKLDDSILIAFRKKAFHLFDESTEGWIFFHNSFRQFLISESAINPLTLQFDKSRDSAFHSSLAGYYKASTVEENWKMLYHLYQADQLEEFIENSHPEDFVNQLISFRPAEEIQQDIKLGLRLSKSRKNSALLVRYLFAGSELQRRLFHFDPASFAKEFLLIHKPDIAKRYLRNNNILLCNKRFALRASRWFFQFGDKVEAKILFSLAEPNGLEENRIVITEDQRFDEISPLLQQWASTSVLFVPLDKILPRIEDIIYIGDKRHLARNENEENLRVELLYNVAVSLIKLSRFDDVNIVLDKYNLTKPRERTYFFHVAEFAIKECISQNDNKRASELLINIKQKIPNPNPFGKIVIADLEYRITGNTSHITESLKGIDQSPLVDSEALGYEGDLDPFRYRILYNKLLNLSGNGQSILEAVPASEADKILLVEFERMLCLVTQIYTDGLLQKEVTGDINQRVKPIVRFFYRYVHPRDRYWYWITQAKKDYYEFLISAVSFQAKESFSSFIRYLFTEFTEHPGYWPSSLRRSVIIDAMNTGFDRDELVSELKKLETYMLDEKDVSGRIDECEKQATAWIKMGDFPRAENFMKNAIITSIGIGYRKDYQFNTWIDWLIRVNELSPGDAAERTLWFVSHLKHLKDTTEGGAYLRASEKLASATFKANSHWGLEQIRWQLENGLIHFVDAIVVVLEEILDIEIDKIAFDVAMDIFTQLILFISEVSQLYLFKRVLSKGYLLYGRSFIDEKISILINAIDAKAVEELRDGYYLEIHAFIEKYGNSDDFQKFSIPPKTQLKKEERSSSNTLSLLPDHKTMTQEEILDKVKTYDDLKQLTLAEDKANSYFDWAEVIENKSTIFSVEALTELIALLPSGRRDAQLNSALSKIAFNLGELTLAREYAGKAFEASSSSGWVKHYDGGTRIKALQAFSLIDPKEAQELSFNTFCDDAIATDYPDSYTEYLDEILPIVDPGYDIETIWKEIEEYLKRLFINSIPLTNLPKFESRRLDVHALLADFLLYLCKHPVTAVNGIVKKIIVKHLDKVDSLANAVKYLSKDEYLGPEIFTELMIGLSIVNPQNLANYIDELRSLDSSDNYFIQTNMQILLSTIDAKYSPPRQTPKPLSKIYELEIPENTNFKASVPLEGSQFVEDTDDPVELIKPFNNWLRIISKATGIRESNIAYRWKQIMFEVGGSEMIKSQYEKDLRANLNELDFKYAYPRPRTVISKRALLYLVNELCANNFLSKAEFFKFLVLFDYTADFIISAIKKPRFIQKLTTGERSYVNKEWVNQVENCSRLSEGLIEYEPGWFVISEFTIVRSLYWGLATETYMMDLKFNEDYDENDTYLIYGSVFDKLVNQYHDIEDAPARPFITIINDNRFTNFDMKTHWLAFNPVLAAYLDWVPSEKGHFGWSDSEDNLMVKSIFWRDGNINMSPPKLNSYTGEGWLVIVSKIGLEKIKSIEASFKIEKRVLRENTDDGILDKKDYDKSQIINL